VNGLPTAEFTALKGVVGSLSAVALIFALTTTPGMAAEEDFPADGSWVVPAGVSVVQVNVTSGSGGDGGRNAAGDGPALGGLALTATAQVPVTPGETIYIGLGENGQDNTTGTALAAASAFGMGSGGKYAYGPGTGGGGGGASAVAIDDDIVLIAGAGGGAGGWVDMAIGTQPSSGAGGAAGPGSGSYGEDSIATPDSSAGGLGGSSLNGTPASTLSRTGSGGGSGEDSGGCCNAGGGGGGAGYYGGLKGSSGGGDFDEAAGGGGGGGSSYASPSRVGIYWSVTLASRGSTPSGSIQYIDITTTTLPDATAGTGFSTTLSAGFGTGSTVNQWTVSPSLPAGLSLDASTGVLSGTPSAASTAAYTFTASQVSGGTVFARSSVDLAFTVASEPTPTPTVEPPPVNPSSVQSTETVVSAPLVSAVTPGNFTWQRDLESAIRVVDNRGGDATFTVEPELPTGLSLDPHAGIIRGIPTVVHRQSAFVVTATNLSGTNSATILVSVSAVGPSGAVLAAVESIRFPARSSRLTKAAKAKLAIWLETYPDQVLSLTGVMPQSGKGKALARKRAVHIRAYLRARGAKVATTIQLVKAASPVLTRRVLMRHGQEVSPPS